MLALLVVVLVVWLVFVLLGFLIKGFFWLAVIGIILFIATAIFGGVKRSSLRR